MLIIKNGIVPELYLSGTCTNCGCQVKCRNTDPLVTHGTSHTASTVKCPMHGCGYTIQLIDKTWEKPGDSLQKAFDELFGDFPKTKPTLTKSTARVRAKIIPFPAPTPQRGRTLNEEFEKFFGDTEAAPTQVAQVPGKIADFRARQRALQSELNNLVDDILGEE